MRLWKALLARFALALVRLKNAKKITLVMQATSPQAKTEGLLC